MPNKKQSCILHIGAAKTGTTALQFGLADYDDGDTAYARFPTAPDNPNHSVPLVLAGLGAEGVRTCVETFPRWMESGDKLRWSNSLALKMMLQDNRPPDTAAYQTALAASVTATPHDRMIFSGEALFGNYNSAAHLVSQLRQRFDHISVICYLRPCVGGTLARFKQRLTAADPVLFFSRGMRGELSKPAYKDAEFLAHWQDAVQCDELQIAVYDPAALKNGDIIDDFSARTGLDATRIRRVRTNVSFSAEATAVLATLSSHGDAPPDNPHFRRNKRYFNMLMSQFGGGKLGVSDAFAADLFQSNNDSLDWIDRESGCDFSRGYSGGSHLIGRHQDLWDICETALPDLTAYLVEHGGPGFAGLPQSAEGFANAMSKLLCTPDPFPARKLPDRFDAAQYLLLNPDVARAGADAADHFMQAGCYEGRFF